MEPIVAGIHPHGALLGFRVCFLHGASACEPRAISSSLLYLCIFFRGIRVGCPLTQGPLAQPQGPQWLTDPHLTQNTINLPQFPH